MQIRVYLHRYRVSLWMKIFQLPQGASVPSGTFVLKNAAITPFFALSKSTISYEEMSNYTANINKQFPSEYGNS